MKVVAFIPARGGSTRIPRKNLQTVGSSSLLARAVFAAYDAGCQPVVSTDDPEIAAEAHRLVVVHPGGHVSSPGAIGRVAQMCQVHDRPAELSDAHAQIEAAIAHWWAATPESARPDALVLLQPTSPFRTGKHIREAIELLRGGWDAVEGVRDISQLYAFRGCPLENDYGAVPRGSYVPARQPFTRPRSQDIAGTMFSGNGALWAFTREHWERTGDRMWGAKQTMLVMDEISSFDVDTPEDLSIARAISAATGR